MTRVRILQQTIYPVRPAVLFLAAMLFIGCIGGVWLSQEARYSFSDAWQTLGSSAHGFAPVMISLLPLILSALAVYVKWPVFLFPLAFWKAFFFSYVFSGFMGVLGSAGWMVCSLGLFSGICSLPVLCWYWLCHIGGAGFSCRTFLPAAAAITAISLTDLRVISPFLAAILIS